MGTCDYADIIICKFVRSYLMKKEVGEKIWKMARKIEKRLIKKISNIDPIILQLLINREIKDYKGFLEPNFKKGQHDPFLLDGIKIARKRILKAIKNKERVMIFGHYDCDGVCAVALMSEALEKLGLKAEVYIPTRKEGYQIKEQTFGEFKKKNISLIITVDFGITDVKAAEFARKDNIDLIITDHHQPPKKLPKAHVIVNPHLSKKYPFKELCGASVVYKLISTLISDEKFLKWSLDLVALATIADVVPLIDENRIFTKYGLIVLQKTRRIGLKKLYQKAGIDKNKINTYSVGFQIAPRLNASGRMDHALSSYCLLKTKNKKEAERIVDDLNRLNIKRQRVLEKSLQEALEKIKKDRLAKNKLIIVSDKKWAEGILGLIAGKVTEMFSRPTIALRENGDYFRGSARSIDEFHITNALREYEDILEKVGGHKKAAGLTVKKNLMKDLYDKLVGFASQKLSAKDVIPKVNIDAQIKLKNINQKFWNILQKLEPYGYGNPKPVFATSNLSVKNIRSIGNDGKHLSMNLSDGENFIRAIGFGMGKMYNKIKIGDEVDVAYNIDLNQWNGQENLELKLIDIKNPPSSKLPPSLKLRRTSRRIKEKNV